VIEAIKRIFRRKSRELPSSPSRPTIVLIDCDPRGLFINNNTFAESPGANRFETIEITGASGVMIVGTDCFADVWQRKAGKTVSLISGEVKG